MFAGQLRIRGRVQLSQFWPEGESDADTVKVIMTVNQDSFEFRPSLGATWRPTPVYFAAGIWENRKNKSGTKKVWRPLVRTVDGKRQITARLQGIDAPELHYQPPIKGGAKFRQPKGETATIELARRIETLASGECTFVTAVDLPGQAIDKYQRFVGDIVFNFGQKRQFNVNLWLASDGWAMPGIYNSMARPEIETIVDAARRAEKAELGIWPSYHAQVDALNRSLVYRRGGPVDTRADRGNVIMPKLFRRLCAASLRDTGGWVRGDLRRDLAAHAKRDVFRKMSDFMANGWPKGTKGEAIASLLSATDRVGLKSWDIVFREDDAKLKDKDGKELKTWW